MKEHILFIDSILLEKYEILPRMFKGGAPEDLINKILKEIDILKEIKEQLALTGVVQAKPEVCDCCGSDTSGTVNLCKECADDI